MSYLDKYYELVTRIAKDSGVKIQDVMKIVNSLKHWLTSSSTIQRYFTKELNVVLKIEQDCMNKIFGT